MKKFRIKKNIEEHFVYEVFPYESKRLYNRINK